MAPAISEHRPRPLPNKHMPVVRRHSPAHLRLRPRYRTLAAAPADCTRRYRPLSERARPGRPAGVDCASRAASAPMRCAIAGETASPAATPAKSICGNLRDRLRADRLLEPMDPPRCCLFEAAAASTLDRSLLRTPSLAQPPHQGLQTLFPKYLSGPAEAARKQKAQRMLRHLAVQLSPMSTTKRTPTVVEILRIRLYESSRLTSYPMGALAPVPRSPTEAAVRTALRKKKVLCPARPASCLSRPSAISPRILI